ncbi:MAG: fused MFS/spermidine synthase [Planctomycetota bacterium]
MPLFLTATFAAAALLFCVQPMIGKQLLPMLGGSPAVWNVCMLFFQVALLGGYAYAHGLSRLTGKQQLIVHAVVLGLAALTLPIGLGVGAGPTGADGPTWWLLRTLATSVGLPFFALATAAPLLQRWFSGLDHAWSADPYFLYAASNAGSMLALLGYPLVIEPGLTVPAQLTSWSVGFFAFGVLAVVCGFMARRGAVPPVESSGGAPTWRTRLLWVATAFVPSSLMLGVTQHITTDIATTPLLWILPLAVYLLTFIVAFTRRGRIVARGAALCVPLAVVTVATLLYLDLDTGIGLRIGIHLAALFVIGLACHGRLAEQRPHARHLTGFYLWLAAGGALGGVFNGLLAPLLFDSVLEYPLVIVAACALRGRDDKAFIGDVVAGLVILLVLFGFLSAVTRGLGLDVPTEAHLTIVLAAVCLLLARNRWRFVAGVAIFLAVAQVLGQKPTLHTERTFFGVYRVIQEPSGSGEWRHLYHGTTNHGSQYSEEPWALQPTLYYTLNGPVGEVVQALDARPGPKRVACVGLGCGSLALAGKPDWQMTFFEIDPAVIRIARDSELFTNLQKSPARLSFVAGDARLELSRTSQRFDAIILDAFSSDSIPVHLLTREAIALYFEHLQPDGFLALHISSRYLDLRSIVAALASDAGLAGRVRLDTEVAAEDLRDRRKEQSEWAALARSAAHLQVMGVDPAWHALKNSKGLPVFTDDYAPVLSALR